MSQFFAIALVLATVWFCFIQIEYSEAFTHKHWVLGNVFMAVLITCSAFAVSVAFG